MNLHRHLSLFPIWKNYSERRDAAFPSSISRRRPDRSPSCGKDVNIGAGLLIGYNLGPVDVKFIYANAFYSRDTVGSNTGSEFFLKTSFKLWSPEEAPKKTLITK